MGQRAHRRKQRVIIMESTKPLFVLINSHGGRIPCFHGWDVTITQCLTKGGGSRLHIKQCKARERDQTNKRFRGSLCRIALSGRIKWRLSNDTACLYRSRKRKKKKKKKIPQPAASYAPAQCFLFHHLLFSSLLIDTHKLR